MLDQLVESKSHAAEGRRRSGFLFATFLIITTMLTIGLLSSLFAKDYDMGGDSLSLETLVAPPVVEEAPEPEPEKQPEKDQKAPNVDVREKLIATMTETPPKVPDSVSSEKSKIPPRDPNRYTVPGDRNFSSATALDPNYKGKVNTDGSGSDTPNKSNGGESDEDAGKPAPPPLPDKPKAIPKQISKGVLNGSAISLPKPAYPAAARALRAGGAVAVQVLIDENGNVVSASAVSGHPSLRAAAAAAARNAKFSPTKLSGQPVKVSGTITYNFVP